MSVSSTSASSVDAKTLSDEPALHEQENGNHQPGVIVDHSPPQSEEYHGRNQHHEHHQLQRTGSATAEVPLDDLTEEVDLTQLTRSCSRTGDKLVAFQPGDKDDPKNWSRVLKWHATLSVSLICFVVAFSSSVVTADIFGMTAEFGVSTEVGLLSITLFVIGFGLGMFLLSQNPLITHLRSQHSLNTAYTIWLQSIGLQ
jgi:hypothetical protein